jgi:hypothetical protein
VNQHGPREPRFGLGLYAVGAIGFGIKVARFRVLWPDSFGTLFPIGADTETRDRDRDA